MKFKKLVRKWWFWLLVIYLLLGLTIAMMVSALAGGFGTSLGVVKFFSIWLFYPLYFGGIL